MLLFRRLAILALLALAAIATPAAAAKQTGTPAWLINASALKQGPGSAYQVVGELNGETRIQVDRCSKLWCQVHAEGQRGWVSLSNVSFGQHPRGPLTGPRLDYPAGGTVCFYTGRNYTGTAYCNGPGFVVTDLLLLGIDNSFSSVQVDGGSVTACRNRDFQSYCERIVESQPVLHGFLDNGVSSYHIW